MAGMGGKRTFRLAVKPFCLTLNTSQSLYTPWDCSKAASGTALTAAAIRSGIRRMSIGLPDASKPPFAGIKKWIYPLPTYMSGMTENTVKIPPLVKKP